MRNTTDTIENVADIIKVMQGGIEFYQDAIEHVRSNKIKRAFQHMIEQKQDAIDTLQPFAMKEKGAREVDSDWIVDTRKLYTKLIGKLSSDEQHTYISQLEEVEDRVLDTIDKALAEDQPEKCLTVLRGVRVRAQKAHDQMKSMQDATA